MGKKEKQQALIQRVTPLLHNHWNSNYLRVQLFSLPSQMHGTRLSPLWKWFICYRCSVEHRKRSRFDTLLRTPGRKIWERPWPHLSPHNILTGVSQISLFWPNLIQHCFCHISVKQYSQTPRREKQTLIYCCWIKNFPSPLEVHQNWT